jgi:hypothetical protein
MSEIVGEGKILFGRFYTGPEYYAGLGTMGLIVGLTALFNVFTAPYFVPSGVLAALIVTWIAQLVSIATLGILLLTDPGIVPRSGDYRDQFDPVKGVTRPRPPPMIFENSIRSFPVRSKFCESCGSVRAPRTVHCSSDDVDMERFDHHCPWLGCCVAKRNYKVFLIFLISLSVSCLGVLGISIAHLALYTLDDYSNNGNLSLGSSIRTSLAGNIPVAIVAGVTVLFMWFVVGLTAYHIYLASHAMTTYEHIRGAFDSIGNPHDKGLWIINIITVFTEPIRPSWIDTRSRKLRTIVPLESELEPALQRRITSVGFHSQLTNADPVQSSSLVVQSTGDVTSATEPLS